MNKVFSTSVLALFAASATADYSSSTCLTVTTQDAFGDGWGADMVLTNPSNDEMVVEVNCGETTNEFGLCPSEDGVYVVSVPGAYAPAFAWEIGFKVEYNATEIYSGGFNSTMGWQYELATDSWQLVYEENLVPNTKVCGGCEGSKACKPKPKKKHGKKKHGKKGPGKKDDDDDKKKKKKDDDDDKKGRGKHRALMGPKHKKHHGKPSPHHRHGGHHDLESMFNMTNSTEEVEVDYSSPYTTGRVTMYADAGEWWQDDYSGASYYISNFDGSELIHSGSLCDDKNGKCMLCLGDGPYIFRVTGAEDNTTDTAAWDFCGTQGDFADELLFHVYNGECIPDALFDASGYCSANMTSSLTIYGMMSVSGVNTELFSDADAMLFIQALGKEMGNQALDIELLTTTLDTTMANRKLSTYVHNIEFQFTVMSSAFQIYEVTEPFVAALEMSIDDKISSGEYLDTLSSMATVSSNDLTNVNGVSLVALEVKSISYYGGKEMVQGLPAVEQEYTFVNESYDVQGVSIFAACAAFAFVVFGGIVAHRVTMTSYDKIGQDSEHVAEKA